MAFWAARDDRADRSPTEDTKDVGRPMKHPAPSAIVAVMDARDLRAYLERDWTAVEASKREHWAREFATRGAEATLEVAEALRRHVRSLRPEWPTEQERREDLEHHVALKRLIDRAARVFANLPAR